MLLTNNAGFDWVDVRDVCYVAIESVEKATPATTDLKVLSVVLNQICPSAPVSDKFVLTDLIALPRIFLYVLIINLY